VRALLDFLDEQIAEEDFATQEALINAQGTSSCPEIMPHRKPH
jgi:hypothetical protein